MPDAAPSSKESSNTQSLSATQASRQASAGCLATRSNEADAVSYQGVGGNGGAGNATVGRQPSGGKQWESLTFCSTLYLRPILDALLAPTPDAFHDELRLGLQEALVNAAKHGNRLDPQKLISVRYAKVGGYYWWVVTDQGEGFAQPLACTCPAADQPGVSDCGRGLFILHQVFDQVRWSNDGKEVHLAKQARPMLSFVSLISPAHFIRLIESWWQRWSAASSAHSL